MAAVRRKGAYAARVQAAAVVRLIAVLHPQQLVLALVELVVADADRVDARVVEELDRGLVVEEAGQERRRADHVAAPTTYVSAFSEAEPLQVRREVLRTARRTVIACGAPVVGLGTQQSIWIVPGVFASR